MKKYRLLTIIMIAVMALTIVTGCSSNSKGGWAEKNSEIAEKLLEEKYGEDCTIKEVYSQKIGDDYFEGTAIVNSEPDITFEIEVDIDRSTKGYKIFDNRAEQRVCYKLSQNAASSRQFPDNTMFYVNASGPQPITDDIDISIQDYLELDDMNKFILHIASSNKDQFDAGDLYYRTIGTWKNLGVPNGTIKLYLTNDSENVRKMKEYLGKSTNLNSFEFKDIEDLFTNIEIQVKDSDNFEMTVDQFRAKLGQ